MRAWVSAPDVPAGHWIAEREVVPPARVGEERLRPMARHPLDEVPTTALASLARTARMNPPRSTAYSWRGFSSPRWVARARDPVAGRHVGAPRPTRASTPADAFPRPRSRPRRWPPTSSSTSWRIARRSKHQLAQNPRHGARDLRGGLRAGARASDQLAPHRAVVRARGAADPAACSPVRVRRCASSSGWSRTTPSSASRATGPACSTRWPQVEDHFGALAPLFTAGKTGDAFVAYQDVLRALAAQLGSSAPPAGKPAAGKPGGRGAPTAAARPGAASDTDPALPSRPHRAPVASGTTGLAIATGTADAAAPRWGRSIAGWPTTAR